MTKKGEKGYLRSMTEKEMASLPAPVLTEGGTGRQGLALQRRWRVMPDG